MKRILCYGDSNTWGYMPGTGQRYGANVRWTGVAQKALGSDYLLIEEGMSGRTTVYPHPRNLGRNGREYLLPCLVSQMPLDLVVLMLGTNDLQWTDAYGAALGARTLVQDMKLYSHMPESIPIFAKGKGEACILLVAPPRVNAAAEAKDPVLVNHQYAQQAQLFSEYYAKMAEDTGVFFLDAADYTQPSPVDGLHLPPESHEALGKAIAEKIKEILG